MATQLTAPVPIAHRYHNRMIITILLIAFTTGGFIALIKDHKEPTVDEMTHNLEPHFVNTLSTAWEPLPNSNLHIECGQVLPGVWQLCYHNVDKGTKRVFDKELTSIQMYALVEYLKDVSKRYGMYN